MSHVMSVEEAIIAALNADQAWLDEVGEGQVYSGRAPEGAELPYASIGTVSERGAPVFDSTGYDQTRLIDIWSGEVGKERCARIYKIMHAVLDGIMLPMNEGHMVLGKLRLVTMFTDPDSPTEHGVANYDVVTRG